MFGGQRKASIQWNMGFKVKDISKFAAKISKNKLSLIRLPSQFCVCNSHKLCKLAKFAVGQGKNREFENTV